MWIALESCAKGEADLNEQTLVAMFERVHDSEKQAESAYLYVVDRCHDAPDMLNQYSKFLADIKQNRALAKQIRARASLLSSLSSHGKSALDQTVQSASTKTFRSQSTDDEKANAVRTASFRKYSRIGLVVMACCLACTLGVLLWMLGAAQNTMISLVGASLCCKELSDIVSGLRRMHAVAMESEDCHSAMLSDPMMCVSTSAADVAFEDYRKAVAQSIDRFTAIYGELTGDYLTSYAPHLRFMREPQFEVVVRTVLDSEDGSSWYIGTKRVSGRDCIQVFLQMAMAAANGPLVGFRTFSLSDPHTFRELFYVLENGPFMVRVLDQASLLYQQEVWFTIWLCKLVFSIAACANLLIELCLIVTFRITVVNSFGRLFQATAAAKAIPLPVMQLRVTLLQQRNNDRTSLNSRYLAEKASQSVNASRLLHKKTATGPDTMQSSMRTRLMMRLTYASCIIAVTTTMSVYILLSSSTMQYMEALPIDLLNSGRQYGLLPRISYLMDEARFSQTPRFALSSDVASTLAFSGNIAAISCQLLYSVYGILSVHYSLTYDPLPICCATLASFCSGTRACFRSARFGKDIGWTMLPAAQQWQQFGKQDPFAWQVRTQLRKRTPQ